MADITEQPGSDRPSVPAARVRAPRLRGLRRERLDAVLSGLWDHRLGLVVAPAGSGKTTLLSQFAHLAGSPVAWYRAESGDGDPGALVAHLGQACVGFEGLTNGWAGVEDAAAALDRWPGDRGLIIVDDLHALHGTPAESELERLIDYLPDHIVVLAASRRQPGFSNLSRLRVSGDLLEISADDLRFRSWEVERLFRDVYGASLPPEDTSTLTRRTEGWAAGLQLFHLATRGKPASERRRQVAALGTRSKLVREYLTENVIGELPEEQRDFLVSTCVLGRLTAKLCDDLLGRSDSGEVLEELERQQLFTVSVDGGGTYRYHEVLRTHLEAMLVSEVGDAAARHRYQLAGSLLELAEAPVDALRAYCRAEDWEAVARLLGRQGEAAVGDPGTWIDLLPPSLVAEDPWLMLASARRALAAGRLETASDAYDRAEAGFGTRRGADAARAERTALRPWLSVRPERAPGWSGLLRSATVRDPLAVAREAATVPGPPARFVEAVALLLAGRAGPARSLLLDTVHDPDAAPTLSVACLATAALTALYGAPEGPEADQALEAAEDLGIAWASRLCAEVLVVTGRRPFGVASKPIDDGGWSRALLGFHLGLAGALRGETPVQELEDATDRFRLLGAPVCEAWAGSALALALANAGGADALQRARTAAADARSVGAWGGVVLAHLAAGRADPSDAATWRAQAEAVARDWGLTMPRLSTPDAAPAPVPSVPPTPPTLAPRPATTAPEPAANGSADHAEEAAPPVRLRCLGAFSIEVDGVTLDLGSVKPRPRSALRLLAVHAPRAVHKEVIVEALWPEADAVTGTRNLQVAISALRQLLEPGVARGAYSLLVREGEAYRLALPPGAESDLVAFDTSLADGRAAQADGDVDRAADALWTAMDRYQGDLLPEEGPAEWVVKRREALRGEAADAAARLAELELGRGDTVAAQNACEIGLRADRYRDALWRLKVEAQRAAGDEAAAARTEQAYQAMLDELGLSSR